MMHYNNRVAMSPLYNPDPSYCQSYQGMETEAEIPLINIPTFQYLGGAAGYHAQSPTHNHEQYVADWEFNRLSRLSRSQSPAVPLTRSPSAHSGSSVVAHPTKSSRSRKSGSRVSASRRSASHSSGRHSIPLCCPVSPADGRTLTSSFTFELSEQIGSEQSSQRVDEKKIAKPRRSRGVKKQNGHSLVNAAENSSSVGSETSSKLCKSPQTRNHERRSSHGSDNVNVISSLFCRLLLLSPSLLSSQMSSRTSSHSKRYSVCEHRAESRGASPSFCSEVDGCTEESSVAWELDGDFLKATRAGPTPCPDYILAKHPEFNLGELPSPFQMYYFDG